MIAKNFMPHPNECRIDRCLGWDGKQNLDLPAGSHARVLYARVAKSGGAVTLWDSGGPCRKLFYCGMGNGGSVSTIDIYHEVLCIIIRNITFRFFNPFSLFLLLYSSSSLSPFFSL